MRFFLAGIMQGSHTTAALHDQEYRPRIAQLLHEHFADAEVYDPLAEHNGSLGYGEATGREVFFGHNLMCRQIDVLVAFLPEASMGTAIEMWEAFRHGAAVVSIGPLRVNWSVRFLSHAIYDDVEAFAAAIRSGELARCVAAVRAAKPQAMARHGETASDVQAAHVIAVPPIPNP